MKTMNCTTCNGSMKNDKMWVCVAGMGAMSADGQGHICTMWTTRSDTIDGGALPWDSDPEKARAIFEAWAWGLGVELERSERRRVKCII